MSMIAMFFVSFVGQYFCGSAPKTWQSWISMFAEVHQRRFWCSYNLAKQHTP